MQSRRAATALFAMVATLMSLPALAEGSGEQGRLDVLDASERDFRVAVAAHRRGDLALAKKYYLEAIRRDEHFVEAMVNASRVLLAAGERARARHWLDLAERSQPAYPQIAAVRGVAALQTGDVPLAMDALRKANALMPGDDDVRVNLGAALIDGGLPDRAIGVLARVFESGSASPDALFNLGLAHDHAGRPQEAAFFYQRFLDQVALADPDRRGVEARMAELAGEHSSGGAQIGDVLAVTSGPSGLEESKTKENE